MCLPPDASPSLHCLGTVRGVNAAKWAVDQRPFVWASEAKPGTAQRGSLWPSWNNGLYPGPPLPYSRLQVPAPGPEVPIGTDSASSARIALPGPTKGVEFEILQSNVWEPRQDGQDAGPGVKKPFFCSPPARAASGADKFRRSLSREGSGASCTSSPRISAPAAVEGSSRSPNLSTNPVDTWESSESTEGRYPKVSWVEALIAEERMQNTAGQNSRLRGGNSAYIGKPSRIIRQRSGRQSNNNQPPTPKKDVSPRDVSMSEGLSDNEGLSDDEGEGGPGVSEKRRKRMLSNRASAQRSRQRRQERLDTLEVLVAELRVENAALTRKVSNASSVAKKFEEECKTLRDRLGKQEPVPLSVCSNASNESEKTTECSDVADENKTGAFWRAAAAATAGGGTEQTDSRRDYPYPEETSPHDKYSRETFGASKMDLNGNVSEPEADPPKRWNSNISSSSFDYDFTSDQMETGAREEAKFREGKPTTAIPESGNTSAAEGYSKDLYRHGCQNLPRNHSFGQILDSFGMDLAQNEEMDKKTLDSRSVEDIWLESLANCLK